MRVWQVVPAFLDDKRLNGEHGELHVIVSVHLRILREARRQGVGYPDIDWSVAPRIGWRSHPQVTWWMGRTGALIERHDMLADEAAWRKAERSGSPQRYDHYRETHASQMTDFRHELAELDPRDSSYGSFCSITRSHPERVIVDLRQLLEKWESDVDKGRPPRGHDPRGVYEQLVELVGDPTEVDEMMRKQ